MPELTLPTLIAAAAAALLLALFHYAALPYWKSARRTEMPLLLRYALGVLSLLVPFSGVLLATGCTHLLFSLWAIVTVGGSVTSSFYYLDAHFAQISLSGDKATGAKDENATDRAGS